MQITSDNTKITNEYSVKLLKNNLNAATKKLQHQKKAVEHKHIDRQFTSNFWGVHQSFCESNAKLIYKISISVTGKNSGSMQDSQA